MTKSNKCKVSLFAAKNKGEIIDCRANMADSSVHANKKIIVPPFCCENIGVIENSAENDESQETKNISENDDCWQMENVIEIHSVRQLQEISKQVNLGDPFYSCGNYRLMEDLNFHERKWISMGYNKIIPFSGTFDGNGHAITNLYIAGGKKEYVGFFGYLRHAKVRNLSLEGKVKGGKCTGAVAGFCDDSLISSCFVSANVSGNDCTGGFVGANKGKIMHCFYAGTVKHSLKSIVVSFAIMPAHTILKNNIS